MGKQHLARLIAPRTWHIARKEQHWTARPNPGPHKLAEALTLNHLLRTMLRVAKTAKEIKYILNKGQILVNTQPRNDYKFPVGFMDVIQVPQTKESYRILYDTLGKLYIHKIPEAETSVKILKVVGKTPQKKGKMQINLQDGRNFIATSFEGAPGDSVLYDLAAKKPLETFKLEKGNTIYVTSGTYTGRVGKVFEIIRKKDLEEPKIIFEIEGKKHETLLQYCLVVGKEKPRIALNEQ